MRDGWVSPWWQAACLPRKWDVCGVVVPSLTVWHVFALENIGNAYLCGGRVDKDAAAALLLIASRDRDAGRELLQPHRENARRSAVRRIYRKLRKVNDSDVVAACSEYVDTCLRGVSRWQKGGGRPCAVPYAWHIIARLGSDAWDCTYAEARCVCDALAEQAGDDSIMSIQAQEMEDNWSHYEKAAN